MEIFNIENTPKTPFIKFNPKEGKLEIKGRSIPENTVGFYKPLMDIIDQYASNPTSPTQVDFQMEYFNTASSKCIFDMLKRLETMNKQGGIPVNVNWYYEDGDDDMRESGEDFQAKISLPFNFAKRKM
jgi:hypothetical protein